MGAFDDLIPREDSADNAFADLVPPKSPAAPTAHATPDAAPATTPTSGTLPTTNVSPALAATPPGTFSTPPPVSPETDNAFADLIPPPLASPIALTPPGTSATPLFPEGSQVGNKNVATPITGFLANMTPREVMRAIRTEGGLAGFAKYLAGNTDAEQAARRKALGLDRDPIEDELNQLAEATYQRGGYQSPDYLKVEQTLAAYQKARDNPEFHMQDLITAFKADPGAMLADFTKLMLADPELLVTPLGWSKAAAAAGAAAKSAGAGVKLAAAARVAAGAAGAATVGGALIAPISVGQQLGETGTVDPARTARATGFGAGASAVPAGLFVGAGAVLRRLAGLKGHPGVDAAAVDAEIGKALDEAEQVARQAGLDPAHVRSELTRIIETPDGTVVQPRAEVLDRLPGQPEPAPGGKAPESMPAGRIEPTFTDLAPPGESVAPKATQEPSGSILGIDLAERARATPRDEISLEIAATEIGDPVNVKLSDNRTSTGVILGKQPTDNAVNPFTYRVRLADGTELAQVSHDNVHPTSELIAARRALDAELYPPQGGAEVPAGGEIVPPRASAAAEIPPPAPKPALTVRMAEYERLAQQTMDPEIRAELRGRANRLRAETPTAEPMTPARETAVPQARLAESGTLYSQAGGAVVPRRTPAPLGETQVRPDEIIHELAKALDVPIRLGRLTKAAEGIFKSKAEVIRRHGYNDLETIAHEVGHLIEKRFPDVTSLSRAHRTELVAIASKPRAGGSPLPEGVAEYLRLYLSQPAEAARRAPGFNTAFTRFLDAHPAEKKILSRARDQIDAWFRMPPEARMRAKIGEAPLPLGERLSSSVGKDKLITETLDAFHPIKLAARELSEGSPLLAVDDPYLLARLTKGTDGIVDHFLRRGTLAFDFEKRAQGPIGKPLADILAPVSDHLDDFEVYMVARRAQELMGQGRERLFTAEEITGSLQKLESPVFRKAFEEVQTFQRQALEYARDGGMVSNEIFDAVLKANQNYVPFLRILHPKAGARAGFGNQGDVVRRLHGSSLNIKAPLQSIIENTSMLVTGTNRNYVARKMAELAEATQGGGKWMERLPQSAQVTRVATEQIRARLEKVGITLDDKVVDLLGDMQTFFRMAPEADAASHQMIVRLGAGERVAFELEPTLFRAMTEMGPKEANFIVKMLGFPATTLRRGVTMSPDFMLRNIVRDTVAGWLQSKSGFVPGWDSARGALARLLKDDDYWRFQAFGGAYSSLWTGDSARATRRLHEIVHSHGWDKTRLASILNTPKKLARALDTLGEMTEMGTRLGEFKRVYEGGGRGGEAAVRAAFAGREVSTDFAMRGANPAVWFLTRITPFLNAGAQGVYKGTRTLTEEGLRRSFVPTAIKLAAGITIPTVLLHMYNRTQPWYQDLEDWERNLFWHVELGPDTIFRIPKPFEWGLFGATIPEYLVDASLDGFSKENAAAIGGATYNMLSLRVIPPVFLVPLEQWSNKVQFTGRPIVADYSDKLEPFLQYGPYTTETAKLIGKAFNLSPVRIEHAVRGLTGTLGMYALMGSDQIVRNSMDLPEPPLTRWTEKAGVRAFFSRKPNDWSRPVGEFYEALDAAQTRVQSLRKLENLSAEEEEGPLGEIRKDLKRVRASKNLTPEEKQAEIEALMQERVAQLKIFGKTEAAAYAAEAETMTVEGFFSEMTKIQSAMRDIKRQMNDVRASRALSAEEKRTQLDALIRQKNELAKSGNERVKRAVKTYRPPKP